MCEDGTVALVAEPFSVVRVLIAQPPGTRRRTSIESVRHAYIIITVFMADASLAYRILSPSDTCLFISKNVEILSKFKLPTRILTKTLGDPR